MLVASAGADARAADPRLLPPPAELRELHLARGEGRLSLSSGTLSCLLLSVPRLSLKASLSSCPKVRRFGELACKIWSPRNFKGQVSPHEFMQAVLTASGKRFLVDTQGDPVEFVSWLLHELHKELGGTKKFGSSVIDRALQGELLVTTLKDAKQPDGTVVTTETTDKCARLLGIDVVP